MQFFFIFLVVPHEFEALNTYLITMPHQIRYQNLHLNNKHYTLKHFSNLRTEITDEEYLTLRKAIIETVIVQDDIYMTSDPKGN